MDSTKRIIKINEESFKIPTSKTRKKKDAPDKPIKIRDNSKDANPHKNKTVKNKILRFIRQAQQDAYKKLLEGDVYIENAAENIKDKMVEVNGSKENDFNDSVEYLKNLVTQEEDTLKQKQTVNHTIKNRQMTDADFLNKISTGVTVPPSNNNTYGLVPANIQTQPVLPGVMNVNPTNEPPYGCMKYGGSKPTYKEYQRRIMHNTTVKPNYPNMAPLIPTHTVSPLNNLQIRHPIAPAPAPVAVRPAMHYPAPMTNPAPKSNHVSAPVSTPIMHSSPINSGLVKSPIISASNDNERLKEISKIRQIREFIKNKQNKNAPLHLKYMKRKKTIKRTYHVGKSKVHPKVAVLVSNKTIRSNVNKRKIEIKQTPVEDIRRYLVKHGFIRVGSIAPNDVLKQMYESLQLMNADIRNHNPENMLYNYFNDDGNGLDKS